MRPAAALRRRAGRRRSRRALPTGSDIPYGRDRASACPLRFAAATPPDRSDGSPPVDYSLEDSSVHVPPPALPRDSGDRRVSCLQQRAPAAPALTDPKEILTKSVTHAQGRQVHPPHGRRERRRQAGPDRDRQAGRPGPQGHERRGRCRHRQQEGAHQLHARRRSSASPADIIVDRQRHLHKGQPARAEVHEVDVDEQRTTRARCATDPQKTIDEINKFLNTPGVAPTKQADEKCGDKDCYHVSMNLTERAARRRHAAGLAPAPPTGTGTVDVWVQKNDLRPAKVTIAANAGDQGNVDRRPDDHELRRQPVTINPPAESDIGAGRELISRGSRASVLEARPGRPGGLLDVPALRRSPERGGEAGATYNERVSPATGRSRRKPPSTSPRRAGRRSRSCGPDPSDCRPRGAGLPERAAAAGLRAGRGALDLGSLRTDARGRHRRSVAAALLRRTRVPTVPCRTARRPDRPRRRPRILAEVRRPVRGPTRPRSRRWRRGSSRRLNPEQARAVTTTDGPLLILAGAGSGKTRVLAHRVAYLVGVKGVRPWQILAVTFTNRAAGELRERIIGLVGEPGRDVQAGTFHAICARVLRRDGEAIGINRRFVIYDTEDQTTLMKQILKAEDMPATGEFRPSVILGAISRAKNEMVDPAWAGGDGRQPARPDGGPARAGSTTSGSRAVGALDFDDLLLEAVRLFDEAPEALAALPGTLAVPPRRRVPGHEPAAVPVGQGARPSAPQPRRRRRRRPVDLFVARRRPAQHPRLRARLARRDGRQARAELPLDAADPRRRPRGRLATTPRARTRSSGPRTPAAGRSSASRPTTRKRRPSGSRARSRRSSAARGSAAHAARRRRGGRADAAAGHRGDVPDERPVAARSRNRSCATASATSSSAARGSTSGARSRTRWRTCGCCARDTDASASSGSSTCRRARSATRRSKRCARTRPRDGGRRLGRHRAGAAGGSPSLAPRTRSCARGFVGARPAAAGAGRRAAAARAARRRSSSSRATGRCWPTAREEGEERWANLLELREVTTRYDDLSPEDALDRLLEETALVADQDAYEGDEGRGHADHAPRREGPRVPGRVHRRPRGRRVPARARARATSASWRRSAGSRTSGITRAKRRLYLSHAWRRATWGMGRMSRAVAVPARDPGRADGRPAAAAGRRRATTSGHDLDLVFGARRTTRFGHARSRRPAAAPGGRAAAGPGAPAPGEAFRPSRDLAAKREAYARRAHRQARSSRRACDRATARPADAAPRHGPPAPDRPRRAPVPRRRPRPPAPLGRRHRRDLQADPRRRGGHGRLPRPVGRPQDAARQHRQPRTGRLRTRVTVQAPAHRPGLVEAAAKLGRRGRAVMQSSRRAHGPTRYHEQDAPEISDAE